MSSSDKYTEPELREEVKEEVKAGDKGGAPGQWSARKAQMMASEYKKRGGGYTTDKETGQDERQKHLSEWGEEEWQTKEGSGDARQADGTEKRYLPKKAWESMTEEEKEETEKLKEEGGRRGEQYVENTDIAKEARKDAQGGKDGEEDGVNGDEGTGQRNGGAKGVGQNGDHKTAEKNGDEDLEEKTNGDHKTAEKNGDEDLEEKANGHDAEPEAEEEEEEEEDDAQGDEDEDENGDAADNNEGAKTGQKRSHPTHSTAPSKKQKSSTTGKPQKTDEAPAQAGSADRLPNVGQNVTWHSLPGYVHGTVVEIATEEKEVEGKKVKGAEGDPRIVLKSESGKVAVHKPEAVFFDDEGEQ